jgi:hypothetical protein
VKNPGYSFYPPIRPWLTDTERSRHRVFAVWSRTAFIRNDGHCDSKADPPNNELLRGCKHRHRTAPLADLEA